MGSITDVIIEKHAESVKDWFHSTDYGKWYNKTKASPVFKAKKMLGTAALISAPVLYGIHKATESPEPTQVGQKSGLTPVERT